MKRWMGAALVLAVSVLTTARGQQPVPPTPEYVPGEVLVKYRSIVQPGRRNAIAAARRGRLVRRFDQLDIDHLQLEPTDNVAATVAALRAMPEVAAAAPNYVRHAVQAQSAPPNDPRWLDGSLWGLVKIQAQSAWNTLNARGDGSVVIMDIDTGLNYNHQDLAANVWTNPGETAGNGVDDDHDGYIDDVHGIDTVNHDSNPIDDNGHGTHTGGTIAAIGNNALGVVGVNWNAKILPCKFLNAGGSGSDAGAAECLNYAVTLKTQHSVNIRVTNNSWGAFRNGGDFSVLLNAFAAAGNAGIISFVAAGNGDSHGVGLNIDIAGNEFDPASLSRVEPSIVAVAASDQSDARAGFSNFGPNSVALAAPGVGILSTYSPGNVYATASGTSMATPHVAGVAALLSSLDPSLNVMQLKAILTGSVDVLPQWGGVVTTGGRLNAFAAASAVGGGSPAASATFVSTDTTTQGNWQGVYGADGYSIVGDATSLPGYAAVTPIGASTFTWWNGTGDSRALLRSGSATQRVAATWYATTFDLDVNLTGGAHQVALYCLDWDSTSRAQRIDVLNAATSAILDTRNVANFNGGQYVVWNITGHVKFRVTQTGAINSVVSAIFFKPAGPPNQPPTVSLTGPTEGSSYTAPATVPLTATATDPDVGDTIDHVSFFANGTPIGSSSTPVAGVYSFNWINVGGGNYTLNAQSFDSHGTASATSNVRHITVTGGSGGSGAVFVANDTTTQGNWQGPYGSDGYSIVGDATSLPSYATVTPTGASTYTWWSGTGDARALLRAGSGSQRVAGTWYAATFDLDVNLTGGAHQVALYCLDWDSTSRAQRIDVIDAVTSAPLDTRNVTNFHGGQYVVWNVTGHVKFRVTQTGALNSVVSAIFFRPAGPPNTPPIVGLTGPPEGSTYVAPASVPMTATASDPDSGDTIDHVSFFANGTQVGTSSVPLAGVYSFNWTSVGGGNYTLTAQSFDNHGTGSAVSNARHITVTGGAGSSAAFVRVDTTTQGNWQGLYGADGYTIEDDATSLPGYATFTPVGTSTYTWWAGTGDTRALLRAGSVSQRLAATWYATTFDLDVNVTSGTHQVALYCLDWDSTSRLQRIDVIDAVTSAPLDTRTLTNFHNGQYVVWNVTGHVKFRVTQTGALNGVVSAVFFGPGSLPAPEPAAMMPEPASVSVDAPASRPGRRRQ